MERNYSSTTFSVLILIDQKTLNENLLINLLWYTITSLVNYSICNNYRKELDCYSIKKLTVNHQELQIMILFKLLNIKYSNPHSFAVIFKKLNLPR